MELIQIQHLMNTYLAGETLTLKEQIPYLDFAIDELNAALNARYPTFTELLQKFPDAKQYDFFPDKYIRRVVVPGAAWNFYVTDEEGIQSATQYQADFEKGKFLMQRDMLYAIPEEFQAPEEAGFITGTYSNDTVGYRGLEIDLDF